MTQHIYETGVLGQIDEYLEAAWQNTTHELVYERIAYAKGIVDTALLMAITDPRLMRFLALNLETVIDNAEMYAQDKALVPLCDAWMLLNPDADYSDYQGVVKVPVIGVLNTGTRQVDIPIVDGSQSLEDQLSDEVYIGNVIVTDEGNYRITPLGYARTVWLFKYDKDYREAVSHLMGDIAKRNLSQEEHALAMLHDDAMSELEDELPFAYPEAVVCTQCNGTGYMGYCDPCPQCDDDSESDLLVVSS